MVKYSTGELAKLCGVTVRTVQYYDTRGILVPTELSEGGRRVYTEEDLKRMRIICYLRELGFSIDAIGRIFREPNNREVISLLLEEQRRELTDTLTDTRGRLARVEALQSELRGITDFSVDSIGDLAYHMEGRPGLRRLRGLLLAVGIAADLIQVVTLVLWITRGIWLPFVLGMGVVVALEVWVFRYYTRRTAYICPGCHHVFAPTLREVLWSYHTPRTRKLSCPRCHHKGFCVETLRR